jgi:hypothetical protein
MTHQQLHQHATGGRCYGHTPNDDINTMQIYDHESCMIVLNYNAIQYTTLPAALVVEVVVAVIAMILCTVVVVG